MDKIIEYIDYFTNNSFVQLLSILCGFYGLYLTIRVKMTVDKFNEKIIFNEQQNFYINQFKNYKEIVSDVEKYSNIPDIVLTDIYRDLTRFKTQCSSILTLRDRTNTNFLIWHIKKKKIDRKLLGYQLSYFEGRFYKRENF